MNADQARMARAALKMSVHDAAAAAKVSPNAVVALEAGLKVINSTREKIRKTYEAAGIEFIAECGAGPGLRLRKGK